MQAAIQAESDINDNSRNGHRPLQIALRNGYTEVAGLLIKSGADILYQDRSGQTPLQAALNYERSQFGNDNFLIRKGASFNPYDLSADYTNSMNLLLSEDKVEINKVKK